MNATRLASREFRWNYLLAKVQQLQGHADAAIRSYQVATALQLAYVPAHINLGNLYLELNRLEEAKARFGLALQKEPNNAAAHYGLGQVALSQRNYAEAVQHLQRALELVPGANRIHYPLALAYRGLGNVEKARAHLAQQGTVGVRIADPFVDRLAELVAGARVHMIRGKSAIESRRYEEAAGEFREAIERQPDNVAAYVNLGGVLTQLGDVRGATEQFDKALQLDARNLTAHFNLAILSAKENNHAKAIEHLRVVLTENASDSGARMFLARELSKANRVDEAIVEYSKLVSADLNNEVAVLERVQVLQRKGEYKAALAGLERAHNTYPQKSNTAALLAYLLATSPDTSLRDGTRARKLAQDLYSSDASLQNGTLLVLALAELGRCTEAAQWQRKLINEFSKTGDQELIGKLKTELTKYENVKSCRP
jgi:tetratricopeptide (TPR) repeat protein